MLLANDLRSSNTHPRHVAEAQSVAVRFLFNQAFLSANLKKLELLIYQIQVSHSFSLQFVHVMLQRVRFPGETRKLGRDSRLGRACSKSILLIPSWRPLRHA